MHTVQDKVLSVLASNSGLPVEEISTGDTLDKLHIDSLELLQVGLDLEEEFGQAAFLGEYDLAEIGTVQDLIDYITHRL